MEKYEIEAMIREGKALNLPVSDLEEMLAECKICPSCKKEAFLIFNGICDSCYIDSNGEYQSLNR